MPAGTPVFASGYNTWVQSPAATKGLMVGYARNPKDFKQNRFLQIIECGKPSGLYGVWTSRQGARIMTPEGREFLFPDGADRPSGAQNLESFVWNPLVLARYAPGFVLGNISIEAADFPILIAQSQVPAQQLMTLRALQIVQSLQYPPLGNAGGHALGFAWGTNTAATASGISGVTGNWSNGSDGLEGNNPPNIKICLNFAQSTILKNTIGAVQPRNMKLLVNPNTASKMATSPEVFSILKYGPFARERLEGKGGDDLWGLPPELYGLEVVVEDTVVNTAVKGATDSLSYALPDNQAYIVSRVGGIEGLEGTPNWTTTQMFFYKDEMTVKMFNDVYNERTVGSVQSMFAIVVPNVYSAFFFQNVFA